MVFTDQRNANWGYIAVLVIVVLILLAHVTLQKLSDPYKAKPSVLLVQQIEQQMQKEHCVGALRRWSRHYRFESFKAADHLPDENTVDITYKQVSEKDPEGSFSGLPSFHREDNSGKLVFDMNVEDRPKNLVLATYNVRYNFLDLGFCGYTKGG